MPASDANVHHMHNMLLHGLPCYRLHQLCMLAGYAQVIEHVEELRVTKEPAAQDLNGATPAGTTPAGATPAGTMGRAGSGQPLLEAVLGHGLRHANVVETYKYATRRAEVHLPVAHVMACHAEPHLCSIGKNYVRFIKKNNNYTIVLTHSMLASGSTGSVLRCRL